MAGHTLFYWPALVIYTAGAGAILFTLLTAQVTGRWRRAAFAFVATCLAGIAISLLLLSPVHAVPAGLVGVLYAFQAATMTWGALTCRSELLDILRGPEVLARLDSMRRQYVDGVNAVVATLDTDGVIRHMNRYGLELLGCSADEVVGRDAFELWGTVAADVHARAEFERFCESGGQLGASLEYVVNTTGGQRIMRWRRSAVLNEFGEVLEVISYGEDLTDQRRMEADLRSESALLDAVQDSVIVKRLNGEVLYLNQAAHDMRGYSREEFLVLEPFSWIAPESRKHASEQQQKAAETGTATYEAVNLTKHGRRLPFEARSQLVTFKGEPALMTVSRDISARIQAEELVSQMAFDDPLTGLPNRRRINDRLQAAISELGRGSTTKIAVIYVDIDNLKAVNDTVGHDAGDRLIMIMGDRLSWVTREGDTLGRLGGDEFVLVVPDLTVEAHAEDIAQRLLEFASETVQIESLTVRPSASIGICYPEIGMSASEAVKRADRAMYVAKKSGGNRFEVYDSSMDAAISERYRLKHELADAIDGDELEIHFQPIIGATGLAIASVETLVRWQHPTRGLLMPEDFIDIAEESNLIIPLGRWVLFEACAALARWRQAGFMVPQIAVNISAGQVIDGDLVQVVSDALAHAGLAPHDLELEITETAMMERYDAVTSVFERLMKMGVGLALDDFGTGHSSLERLQDLPISTLKIDRSFVADLCSESDAHPIIDTILVLASKLDLLTVAEGVERPCHLRYLNDAGCDQFQGYLLGRPCGSREFEAMLTAGVKIDAEACLPCHREGSCKLHRVSRNSEAEATCTRRGDEFDRLLEPLSCEMEYRADLEGSPSSVSHLAGGCDTPQE